MKYLFIQSNIALINDQNEMIKSTNVAVANVHCLQDMSE